MSCSGGTRGQRVVVVSLSPVSVVHVTPPFAPGARVDRRERNSAAPLAPDPLAHGCSQRRASRQLHHRGANLDGGAGREPVVELNAALLKLFSSWEGMHLRRETG